MPPDERKRYVRGVVHNFCNTQIRYWLTLERGRAIVAYLETYHRQKELTNERADTGPGRRAA